SDTQVITMKMEILLEPTSNKLMVGDLCDSIRIKHVTTGKKQCETVTHWFTLIMLAALRRSGNENMLSRSSWIQRILKDGGEAQLEDKDSTICKLKDIIKSMREKSKEVNVKYDYGEIETKNVELENTVANLISENERLCNEINHVKQNLKSAKNEDLKAQIQDKVFMITSLKNDLRKLKGKEIVDIAAQTPSAYTIVPGMFKLDLEPLAPRLFQNKEAHIEYLKYTQK
ncbi:hypothetical protein Tco_1351541, partial [Tanacetum coccineum]